MLKPTEADSTKLLSAKLEPYDYPSSLKHQWFAWKLYELPPVAYNRATVLPSHDISISLPHLLLISPCWYMKLTETGLVWLTALAFANTAGVVDRLIPFLPLQKDISSTPNRRNLLNFQCALT